MPNDEPTEETQLSFTPAELDALKQILQFGLDSDFIREPYPEAVAGLIAKLSPKPVAFSAQPASQDAPVSGAADRLPVKFQ